MGLFNKDENWWLRLTIVIISIASLSLYSIGNKEIMGQAEWCERKTDSLSSEIFILNTTISRYEITLDILKETDSIAAAKFEKILYTETE